MGSTCWLFGGKRKKKQVGGKKEKKKIRAFARPSLELSPFTLSNRGILADVIVYIFVHLRRALRTEGSVRYKLQLKS